MNQPPIIEISFAAKVQCYKKTTIKCTVQQFIVVVVTAIVRAQKCSHFDKIVVREKKRNAYTFNETRWKLPHAAKLLPID